jgi:hypothetical protein
MSPVAQPVPSDLTPIDTKDAIISDLTPSDVKDARFEDLTPGDSII